MTEIKPSLSGRDLEYNWHPCSQMKDYEAFPPLEVAKASGSWLQLEDGSQVLDAISSWWCKSLGHGHPRIRKALESQLDRFEHVIFANTTNQTIVELSEKLAGLTKSLQKVFYAGDGSMAVEIALKMALQAQAIRGNHEKTRFMALDNGYHGESAAALGVSALGLYRDQYAPLLPEVVFIKDLPYIYGKNDPLWTDASKYWPGIEKQLEAAKSTLAGIIVEPILQGAGGMLLYSPDLLNRISLWCQKNEVFLIADEILTGMGRTGKVLACQHAQIEPDFLCLSKGLTSGWMPFSCVLTSNDVYNLFYDDYETGKSFLHSNTFTGNAMGAAIALETLNIYRDEGIVDQVEENLGPKLEASFREVASSTGKLTNIRSLGAMVAGDLITGSKTGRVGYEVFRKAVENGALLRPLGNSIYWLPPLNTSYEDIERLAEITENSINQVSSGLVIQLYHNNGGPFALQNTSHLSVHAVFRPPDLLW